MTTVPPPSADKPHAPNQSAQMVVVAGLAIDRRQADRSQVQAEMRHGSQNEHPCPDENVDAVLRAAHPARENDLREVKQAGAQDADGEGKERVALGALAFAVGGKDVDRLLEEVREKALRRVERRFGSSRSSARGAVLRARSEPDRAWGRSRSSRQGCPVVQLLSRRARSRLRTSSATPLQAQARPASPFSPW